MVHWHLRCLDRVLSVLPREKRENDVERMKVRRVRLTSPFHRICHRASSRVSDLFSFAYSSFLSYSHSSTDEYCLCLVFSPFFFFLFLLFSLTCTCCHDSIKRRTERERNVLLPRVFAFLHNNYNVMMSMMMMMIHPAHVSAVMVLAISTFQSP